MPIDVHLRTVPSDANPRDVRLYDPTVADALGGVNVTPLTGELTLVGVAPTVQTPRVLLPDVGALSLVGIAPTVQTPRVLLPGVGALTIAGYAPTALTPRNVTPDVGALALAGFAPTVAVSSGANVEVLPSTGELELVGYAPAVAVASPPGEPSVGGGGGGSGRQRTRLRKKESRLVYAGSTERAMLPWEQTQRDGNVERESQEFATVAFLAMEWMNE